MLSLLIKRGKGVSATIHSRFTKDFLADLEKHNTQYDEVKFVQLPHKNHDRFLIIDDTVYLLGASVKDMGNGLCAVTKLTATPETVLGLLKWNGAKEPRKRERRLYVLVASIFLIV